MRTVKISLINTKEKGVVGNLYIYIDGATQPACLYRKQFLIMLIASLRCRYSTQSKKSTNNVLRVYKKEITELTKAAGRRSRS
jgi:hypothetical protein